MAAQIYNLSTGETEAGWEGLGQSGCPSKTLSQQRYKAGQQCALSHFTGPAERTQQCAFYMSHSAQTGLEPWYWSGLAVHELGFTC